MDTKATRHAVIITSYPTTIKYFQYDMRLTVVVSSYAMMIIKVFLLPFLLLNVGGVKSENNSHHGTDTENELVVSSTYEGAIPCCSSGNYTFYSIVDALNNVTSNTILNLSTDVVLSSNVTLKRVSNITIIGQGYPTVNCNDVGSVKFLSSNKVTIVGVNWKKCGSVNNPGMEFYNTSNITIQSCSFYHSTGKAVTLSKVSGNVSINNNVSLHTTNTTKAMEQLFTTHLAMGKVLSW